MDQQTKKKFAEVMFREERNKLLSLCDWTQVSDSPLTDTKKTEWATYRQQLRDLPSTAKPKLDENGNVTGVDWPERPE